MSDLTSPRRVGVVGAGRLGRALAVRLSDTVEVSVCDADARKAKQFGKRSGITAQSEHALAEWADLLILCVPPDQVGALLMQLDGLQVPIPLCLNTATAVDTPAVARELGLERVRAVGLKPIGQFTAIALGLPVVFVTSTATEPELGLLRTVLAPLGTVERGDEMAVRDLNRRTTELALSFCVAHERDARPLCGASARWLRSALQNVAVGTILDFPPSPDNDYTRELVTRVGVEAAQ